MRNIQEVFERIQENKKQQRDIKAMYRENLDMLPEYREVAEKLEELKNKKRQIEYRVQEELAGYFEKHDLLKVNIAGDTTMLNDIAVTQFMKGERITLTDSYQNIYEPILSVKFKKTDAKQDEKPVA
jgi:hypothetical protein